MSIKGVYVMRNNAGLITRYSYFSKFVTLLAIISLVSGCAIMGRSRPEPVSIGEVRFYLEEGDKRLIEGNYDKAVESYAAAIKLDPKSVEARRKLGEAHAGQGQVDLALHEFAKIIEIDPNYTHAYNYRGFLYHNQEEYEKIMKENGTKPELEIYDVGHLYNLQHIMSANEGLVNEPIYLQFVTGILGGIGAAIENLVFLKSTADRFDLFNILNVEFWLRHPRLLTQVNIIIFRRPLIIVVEHFLQIHRLMTSLVQQFCQP